MNTLLQDRRTFFHPLSIATHWATLVLLAAVYALIEFKGIFPKGSDAREAMKHWHFVLGLSVFGLVALRLLLRAALPTPPIVPAPPLWQQRLATTMHRVLYVFLIAMPLLGWLTLSAKGRPIPLFGWELPALLAGDRELARRLEDLHEALGTIGYALIGVHAAAALFHHHVMRDNTLVLMLPWAERWARKPASTAER
ncbi:MAG: cytochrome b/b6 domain-containing protein [Burkholderiales bacterium]|nr:cytochrome b/b6 domain-containing protein [Burkholderiales bacterium]